MLHRLAVTEMLKGACGFCISRSRPTQIDRPSSVFVFDNSPRLLGIGLTIVLLRKEDPSWNRAESAIASEIREPKSPMI